MAEVLEEGSQVGDDTEADLMLLAGDCGAESLDCRRLLRKRAMRSPSSRRRREISSPKSPLMRMAEMRRGGLRGRALKLSGKKGFDGSVSKMGKRLKGVGGRGSRMLDVILEEPEFGEGCDGGGLVGAGSGERVLGEDSAVVVYVVEEKAAGAGSGEGLSEVTVDMEGAAGVVGVEMSEVQQVKAYDVGSMSQAVVLTAGERSDLALDLIAAQPLQEMAFVGTQVPPVTEVLEVFSSCKDSSMEESAQEVGGG